MEKKEYDKATKYSEMWLKVEPDNAQAKAGWEKAREAESSAAIKSEAKAKKDKNLSPVGKWKSVDFVSSPEQFQVGLQQWGGDLFLKDITFYPNASISMNSS